MSRQRATAPGSAQVLVQELEREEIAARAEPGLGLLDLVLEATAQAAAAQSAPVLSAPALATKAPASAAQPATIPEPRVPSVRSDSTKTDVAPALNHFLKATPWEALAFWLLRNGLPRDKWTKRDIGALISRQIARLDGVLSRQVNAILHHAAFQKLEASWRGLHYLVEQVEEGANIKVKALNVSWKDLVRDVDRALEFDQSQLFQKVYSEEFGTAGGEPFGVLLGDYEIQPQPSAAHPTDDLAALQKISSVAAAAFAPFLAGAHPSLLDLQAFADLDRRLDVAKAQEQAEYLKWHALRQMEDSRFVGLTLPRVLMRLPYGDGEIRADGFVFKEDTGAAEANHYLWGNAIWAFGGVLVRAFAQYGWLANIRGTPADGAGGGLALGLPQHSFSTDASGLIPKASTDVSIADFQEKELSDLGFIPLCRCQNSDVSAFYSAMAVQVPKKYDRPEATANARISSMLNYMLCVSRVAHYLKVVGREKIGAFRGPTEVEDFLNRWLMRYVLSNDEADLETKAKFPLREFRVQVREHPRKPGCYLAVFHLRPHFQLEQVSSTIRLTTELLPAVA